MGKPKRRIDTMALERIMEHMPVGDEPSLAVLKAHLLVEEQLWGVVSARLASRGELFSRFEKRFQYSRDVALIAEALVPSDDVEFHDAQWVWIAIEKLNSVRNRLAHELEPAGVKERMTDLVNCASSSQELTGELRIDFYLAVFLICQTLEQLRQPVDPTDLQNAF